MSALAPNVPLLLASRAITGAGAAAALPNTLAVLLHAVPDGRKNATIAIWASMTASAGRPAARAVRERVGYALRVVRRVARRDRHRGDAGGEFGSALGVAVIGTVLTARFTAALPAGIRAGHDPRTVAQALAAAAPGRAHEVITAFVSGADAGLRVIGISGLVLGALVVLQSLLSRRSA
jgi:hypothetical protein